MALRLGNQAGVSGLILDDQAVFASAGNIFGTGALVAQDAVVIGTGIRGVKDTGTSPEIDSQGANVSGFGEIERVGVGSALAQNSDVDGTAERKISGGGALQAQQATIAGVGSGSDVTGPFILLGSFGV